MVLYFPACGSRQEADIIFMLDSINAGRKNTKRALAFIKELTNEFDIARDKIQVGLMSAECNENSPGFSLDSNKNKNEVKDALSQTKSVDFSTLLKQMRHGAFGDNHGGRQHAKKVAVLVIDGSLEEPLRTLTEAQRAKLHGVEVIVVQVGEEKPQDEVLMMCDAPAKNNFFKVSDYSMLPAVKQTIWDTLCDGNIKCNYPMQTFHHYLFKYIIQPQRTCSFVFLIFFLISFSRSIIFPLRDDNPSTKVKVACPDKQFLFRERERESRGRKQ